MTREASKGVTSCSCVLAIRVVGSDCYPGGSIFCFADGHVSFLAEDLDMVIYKATSTIQGAEIVADAALR